MPWRAATAIAATAVAGAASTSAQGQEATNTASMAGTFPVISHVPAATTNTNAMYWPAYRSSNRVTGGLAFSASRIRVMMRPSVLSSPTRVSSTCSKPSTFIAPARALSPSPTSTGTDSPVNEARSRLEVPLRTTPSAGMRSPARSSIRSPTRSCTLGTTSTTPLGSSRRLSTSVKRVRARTASCEPNMLRSSRTCPIVMMMGRKAAVIRSPVAHAAIRASATNRSVMPCRLGCRRLCQASTKTGTATSAAATPATSSAIARSSGIRKRIPPATMSRQSAASARDKRNPSRMRSARLSSCAGCSATPPGLAMSELTFIATFQAARCGCRFADRSKSLNRHGS